MIDFVITTNAYGPSLPQVVRDGEGRARVTDGSRFGWARLADIEWETESTIVGGRHG